MKPSVLSLFALIPVALVVLPVFGVGFLADDLYMGERIAARQAEAPGIWSAISDAFVFRWTPQFDVFRPLTILSLQLDHALFGADSGGHHLLNVLLWCACAWVFGAVVAQLLGDGERWFRAGAVLLFGVWPAGVEAVGWLVAREDLLCALFALLGLRALIGQPNRPWLPAVLVIGAFLSKETAVVVPLLLAWADLILDPARIGGTLRDRILPTLRRQAPMLSLIVLYLVLRWVLFGRMGGTYSGRAYLDYLGDPGAVGRILSSLASSLLRLVAPVNDYAFMRTTGISPTVVHTSLGVLFLSLLILGFRVRRPGDLRIPLAGAPWFFAPLVLLVVPLEGVGPGMEKSRFLVLPMVGFGLTVALAAKRLDAIRPISTRSSLAVLALIGACLWQLDIHPYHRATHRAESVIRSLTDHMQPGSGALLLGTEPPNEDEGLHPELLILEGCHVLSAGLFHATLPPYVPAPGIRLQPVKPTWVTRIPNFVKSRDSQTRPHIAEYIPVAHGGPRFRVLAKAGFYGDDPTLSPGHDSTIPPGWEPVFRVDALRSPVASADNIRIVVSEPLGNGAICEMPWSAPAQGMRCSVEIRGDQFRVFRGKLDSGRSLTWEVIETLPDNWFFWWWAEFREGDHLLVRSAYQVVRIGQ